MRAATIFTALALASGATSTSANIAQIAFTGSGVVTYNSGGIDPDSGQIIPQAPITVGDPVSVSGLLKFSDGSDPFGLVAVPDGYTGTVQFTQDDVFDGVVGFSFTVAGGDVGANTFAHHYPYASGYAVLTGGHLTGLNIGTDDDPDTDSLSTTAFGYAFGDSGAAHGGSWTLDVASPTPEPASWAMLIAGFGAVGIASRRRERRTA